MAKKSSSLRTICSDCGTPRMIRLPLATNVPIKCEKCGKVLIVVKNRQ